MTNIYTADRLNHQLNQALSPKPIAPPRPAFTPVFTQFLSAWKWLERKRTQQIAAKRLRVTETISLGEKRFVSIVQVDGAQFLIGGSAGNVSLLAVLDKQQHCSNDPRSLQSLPDTEQA